MRIFFGLVLPLVLLLIPTVFQIVYSTMRIRLKTKLSLPAIFIFSLALGFIFPFIATFVSMYGLSYGVKPGESNCINGIQAFIFLGIVIAVIFTPLIGLTSALVQYLKNRKEINLSN